MNFCDDSAFNPKQIPRNGRIQNTIEPFPNATTKIISKCNQTNPSSNLVQTCQTDVDSSIILTKRNLSQARLEHQILSEYDSFIGLDDTTTQMTRLMPSEMKTTTFLHKSIFKSIVILFVTIQFLIFSSKVYQYASNYNENARKGLMLLESSLPSWLIHRLDKSQTIETDYLPPNAYGGLIPGVDAFDESERMRLRGEAKKMFYHAYHSYLNTYPADEIHPISCRGRFRQVEDSSDIDDSIGNFSLTLVDSLDTLVMMGDINEFDVAIKKIISDLSFDMDIVVSVFETNIRMLGGLLSAHIMAKSIQNETDRNIRYLDSSLRRRLDWYDSEILDLAEDLGRRLLPAFDTKTGIPYPRVNLKYGLETNELRSVPETCTACAGSLILEFATLSRLTGDNVFEKKARQALDSLWQHRHRSTDLVGTVLNVESGEWVRRESGVGAGSDSYYEYLMKAYILLGDPTYLHRFNRHYSSVMRYISRGPFLIDVHMHRPNRIAKGFMDALSAFWPGLQVLKGDLRSAISTHAMFNEVIRRHSYLPEAFTTDLQVYWANHQMRPEFLESTYFLHRATQEDYYLEIGKDVLKKLQELKVSCGFAGLKDVRTGVHDDRMSSFVLAETLKYLYLLFSNDNETHIDLDRFIFSTEGHLLPIDLSLMSKDIDIGVIDPETRNSDFKDTNLDIKSDDQFNLESIKVFKARKDVSELTSDEDKSQRSNRAAIARLLIKMSDKFNQDRAVMKQSNYETSCPSLEAQEMRFDGRYHPFLNRHIGATESPETLEIYENQINHMELLEKVRQFTLNDPDYLKLASSLGLTLAVQPNGIVKVLLDTDQSREQIKAKAVIDSKLSDEEDSNQCMI